MKRAFVSKRARAEVARAKFLPRVMVKVRIVVKRELKKEPSK